MDLDTFRGGSCPAENPSLRESHLEPQSTGTRTGYVSRWDVERTIAALGRSAATDFGASPMNLDSDSDCDEHADWDPRKEITQKDGRRTDSMDLGQTAEPCEDPYVDQSNADVPAEAHQNRPHGCGPEFGTHSPWPQVGETRPWSLAQATTNNKRRDAFKPLLGTKPSPGEVRTMMGLSSDIPCKKKQARVKHLPTRAGQLSGLDLNVIKKCHPAGRFAPAVLATKTQIPYTYWSTNLVELLLVRAIDDARNSNVPKSALVRDHQDLLANGTATRTEIQCMMGISLELNPPTKPRRSTAKGAGSFTVRLESARGTAGHVPAYRGHSGTGFIKYLLLDEISKARDAERVETMPLAQSMSANCHQQLPPGQTFPSRHVDPSPRTQLRGRSPQPTPRRINELLANWPDRATLHRLLGLGLPLTIYEPKAGVARLSSAAGGVSGLDLTVDWKEHQKAGRHVSAIQAVKADARLANWGLHLTELMLIKAIEAARLRKRLMAAADGDGDSYRRAVPVEGGESTTTSDDQREFLADPKTPVNTKDPEDHALDNAELTMATPAEPEAMPQPFGHESEDSVCAQTDLLDQATDTDSSSDESLCPHELTESPTEYDPRAVEAVRNTIKQLESDLLENTELLTREREDVRRLQEHGLYTNAARQDVMRLERNAWEFGDTINGLRRSLADWF